MIHNIPQLVKHEHTLTNGCYQSVSKQQQLLHQVYTSTHAGFHISLNILASPSLGKSRKPYQGGHISHFFHYKNIQWSPIMLVLKLMSQQAFKTLFLTLARSSLDPSQLCQNHDLCTMQSNCISLNLFLFLPSAWKANGNLVSSSSSFFSFLGLFTFCQCNRQTF